MNDPGPRKVDAEWRVTVAADSPYFVGHFPALPIFPGVAVLHDVVIRPLTTLRPDLGKLRYLERAKFRRAILPGQELDVIVRFLETPGHADVRIHSRSELCVTARLCFDGS